MDARTEPAGPRLSGMGAPSGGGGGAPGGGSILLATLETPICEEAAIFAVDSAVESGRPLIVANVTALEPLGLSIVLGYDALEELTPDVSASVRRPVEMANALGVAVQRLRIRSTRPLRALMQLISERLPALVVFGSDPGRLSRRRYAAVVRALERDVGCLLWTPARGA